MKNTAKDELKTEESEESKTAVVVQKVDYKQKLKDGATKAVGFLGEYSTQICMIVTGILVWNFVTAYFGLSLSGGLMLFGGVALGCFIIKKYMDGSLGQSIKAITPKLAQAA